MTDSVLNVVLGLVASAISAGLGWLAQTARRRRRLERTRAFFGLPGGTECLLVVNRHPGAGSSRSVSRNDVFALMELAALVKECGAKADIVAQDQVRQGLGGKAEFCLGGPVSNGRTAAHLTSWLPGVQFTTESDPPYNSSIAVDGESYHRAFESEASSERAYVLLARLRAGEGGRPTFLIAGQTSVSNHAAVRYLVSNHAALARKYGTDGTFVLVLEVVNPGAYGPDVVELASDITAKATARPVAVTV